MLRRMVCLLALLLSLPAPGWASELEILPFQTANRSPVIEIFGLPGPGTAILLPPGGTSVELAAEATQNFAKNTKNGEVSFLDGETYRFNLSLRRGITSKLQLGLDIPYLMHREGFLDSFIYDFHDFFGLPQSGRDNFPKNQLLYSYERDGIQEILVDESAEGFGDIRLSAAWQLKRSESGPPRGSSLHVSLKLPTGDSDRLLGSGSTDLAFWWSGTHGWGGGGNSAWALFGALGALALTDGDVLKDQQYNLVGFGTLGGGWRPLSWLAIKIQFDGNTPFFDSELPEFGSFAGQLFSGVDLALTDHTVFELGIGEDVLVDTAPDATFRLALRSRF